MKSLEYISLYKEQFRSIRRMSAEKVGMAIKALVEYAENGTEPEDMDDGVMNMLDAMMGKVDRDRAKYESRCRKNKQNADARWNNDNGCDGITDEAEECDRMQSHNSECDRIQPNQNQTTPNQTEPNQTEPNPHTTTGDMPQADFTSMMDAAQAAGFGEDRATGIALLNLTREHGLNAMLDALTVCAKNHKTTIRYLSGILRNIRDGTAPPRRKLREQDYEQREYEASSGVPDWMAAMLEAEQAGAADQPEEVQP